MANFIFVSLCNNDFQSLQAATEYVFKNKEVDLTEQDFKNFVVNYVVGAESIRRINPAFIMGQAEQARTREYLERSIEVQYLVTVPDVDHDGGSVVLDTNTGYTWRV